MKRLLLSLAALVVFPASALAVSASPAAAGGQSFSVSTSLSDTNGVRADPTIYNIEGSTYFKLRDLGRLLDFGVTYDSAAKAVRIESDKAYVPVSGESGAIKNTATSSAAAVSSKQTIYVDGKRVSPTVYNIKGNNYMGLRELAALVDFGVAYNYDTRVITAYAAYPYAEESNWTAAMNDLAVNLGALPASSYQATASRYAPIVTGENDADWRVLISTLRAVKDAPPFAAGSALSRANLYWANQLTAAITNTAFVSPSLYKDALPDLADPDLFANPDKSALRKDFAALSAAYLGASPKQAASAGVSGSIAKDARERLSLSTSYATGKGGTAEDLTNTKKHFGNDMTALSSLTDDNARVQKIAALIKDNFRSGGSAPWTTAWRTGDGMDSFSFAAAADYMFYEAGIPAFIARSYSSAWNVVYVNGKWSVFEASAGASLRSLEDKLLQDTHPASTLLLTQAMRPGSSYNGLKTYTIDHYFTYTPITDTAKATAAQMRAYLLSVNPNAPQSVLDMIPHYLTEGAAEGIRGDIAFAQSCLETGNFTFTGSAVTLAQNNFCGLGVVTNGVEGAVFETPQLGIRAQIQHLKAYANRAALKNECIDPRFTLVTRGCAETVQHLGIQENPKGYGWASGADYGTKILNILDHILTYPGA